MSAYRFLFCLFAAALPAAGAERSLDFSHFALDSAPTGFVSTVSGEGHAGNWRILSADVPSMMPPLNANSPMPKRPVLGQLSQDKTDEDFTLTTRFKIVSGETEQMAGLAFRIQDERNYYVVRASAAGSSFRFYKFVNGLRSDPIGPSLSIAAGIWHEMQVECKGNQIRCALDGKDLIAGLTDNSFSKGRIGFWTKSDSVSYFADARISYKPVEPPAQSIVRDMMTRYPRLLGLKIFAAGRGHAAIRMVASETESEIGGPAEKLEEEVIGKGSIYFGKEKSVVSVTMPLRDRNGDAVAALRVLMKPFPGQTEQNALGRALPIKKEIEARLLTAEDLE
jgi:hypothetical protein